MKSIKTNTIDPGDRPASNRQRCATAVAFALTLVAAQVSAQTTLSYGDGTNTPAAQLNGNWNTAGVWYDDDDSSWGDWVDGSIARFYSPAGGPTATITLGSDVSLDGLVKDAAAGHFTVIAQAGHALNFADNSTISVNNNTLAFQAGAISGNNLLVTGTSTGTVRFGPGGTTADANAHNINGLTLENVTLKLGKDNDVAAVGGAVVVNSGVLEHGVAFDNRRNNKYAAVSSLTLNGGTTSVWSTTQTLDSFTWNGGTFTIWASANMNLGGDDALTLRNVTLTRTGGSAGQTYNINLTKNGTQTVRFDAANNGTAIMTEGTALVLGGGEKTFNVANGTATTDMQVLVNSITETAASSIRKTGGGVVAWNVSGANSYSNGMSVEQGALFFTSQAGLPASGVTVSNGAVLGLRLTSTATGRFTEQQFLDLHAGTLSGVTMGETAYAGWESNTEDTLSAALTGTRGLAKLGGNKLILTGDSNYTGGTLINQGNLQIGNGGTSGSITGNVVMASAADSFRQVIFNRSDSLTYDGNISGAGSMRNDGAGILTLTGIHTYTGATTVAAGGLIINGSTAASAVTVGGASATGTPTLGGTGTVGGNVTIAAAGGGAAGTLAPGGTSPGTLVLNNRALSLGTGAKLVYRLGTTSDSVTGVSTLTLNSQEWSDFTFTEESGFGAGTYILIAADAVSGSLGGTVAGSIGSLTGTLSVDGNNDLILTVSSGAGDFSSWRTVNGAGSQALDDDHDNDGVPNGIEYFLGGPNGDTTGFTPVPGVDNTGGTLSITWTMGSGYEGDYGADFRVETSETLSGAWTAETSPGNVTINGNDVTYTFPSPLGARKFARLVVTGP